MCMEEETLCIGEALGREFFSCSQSFYKFFIVCIYHSIFFHGFMTIGLTFWILLGKKWRIWWCSWRNDQWSGATASLDSWISEIRVLIELKSLNRYFISCWGSRELILRRKRRKHKHGEDLLHHNWARTRKMWKEDVQSLPVMNLVLGARQS